MPFPDTSTGRARRAIGLVAGAAALLATASCADTENIASYPCPFVGAVRELSYMTKFEGESQDLSDTLYEAKIDEVRPAVNCVYEDDDGKQAIVYDIQVKFLAQRGPKEREGVARFNYFVGIGGPGGQIIKREVFDTEIEFENNATQAIVIEEIQPRIPLKQGENGDYYRIYLGFMLDEREFAYNRKNPR
ncbi:MAG: hypothetical protein HC861_02605 [Rhodospirillaceae bacterium]|nr:hypothetical protein [Rhodospirillaceae bacterium]